MNKYLKIFIFVCFLVLAACQEQIIHDLGEVEANKLMAHLNRAQLPAQKVKQADGRWAISVDSEDITKAVAFLSDSRLVRDDRTETGSQASIVSSREDQRFKYERSLSNTIESTLNSLSGVLESRVHLNLPPTDPLFGQTLSNAKGSGSVLLITKAGFDLKREEIAALVSGASGIEVGLIAVLISSGETPQMEQSSTNENPSVALNSTEISAKILDTAIYQQAQNQNSTQNFINYVAPILIILLLIAGYSVFVYRKKNRPIDPAKLNEKFNLLGADL